LKITELWLSSSLNFSSAHNLQINSANENIFDVILLDLNPQDMDGLEVCGIIKMAGTGYPHVFILTARDNFADKIAEVTMGADDYLTKPSIGVSWHCATKHAYFLI
jgi:DNA-binding response OmpR family regulator